MIAGDGIQPKLIGLYDSEGLGSSFTHQTGAHLPLSGGADLSNAVIRLAGLLSMLCQLYS